MSNVTEADRIHSFRKDVLDLSQLHFGRCLGGSAGMVQKWEGEQYDQNRPDLRLLTLKLGVSSDWLMGASNEMWTDQMRALQRRLRAHLAEHGGDRETIITWLDEHSDINALAAVARMVDDAHLARLIDVPVEWFETHDNSLLRSSDDRWADTITCARAKGLDPEALKRLIDAAAMLRA